MYCTVVSGAAGGCAGGAASVPARAVRRSGPHAECAVGTQRCAGGVCGGRAPGPGSGGSRAAGGREDQRPVSPGAADGGRNGPIALHYG